MTEIEAARRVVKAARVFWCGKSAEDALMAAVDEYDACVAQLAEAADLKSDHVVVRIRPQAPNSEERA